MAGKGKGGKDASDKVAADRLARELARQEMLRRIEALEDAKRIVAEIEAQNKDTGK
jgi:hypothetical protein